MMSHFKYRGDDTHFLTILQRCYKSCHWYSAAGKTCKRYAHSLAASGTKRCCKVHVPLLTKWICICTTILWPWTNDILAPMLKKRNLWCTAVMLLKCSKELLQEESWVELYQYKCHMSAAYWFVAVCWWQTGIICSFATQWHGAVIAPSACCVQNWCKIFQHPGPACSTLTP